MTSGGGGAVLSRIAADRRDLLHGAEDGREPLAWSRCRGRRTRWASADPMPPPCGRSRGALPTREEAARELTSREPRCVSAGRWLWRRVAGRASAGGAARYRAEGAESA